MGEFLQIVSRVSKEDGYNPALLLLILPACMAVGVAVATIQFVRTGKVDLT